MTLCFLVLQAPRYEFGHKFNLTLLRLEIMVQIVRPRKQNLVIACLFNAKMNNWKQQKSCGLI